MSISAKELVALATAGFNSVQIAQISAAYDAAPAPAATAPAAPAPAPAAPAPAAPAPAPAATAPAAPAPAPAATAPAAPAAPAAPVAPDPMDKVIAQLQQLTNAMQNGNALMSNQPQQQTPEGIIAEIIRPPKPVNK